MVAALIMLAFTALLYVIELVDQLTGESLDSEGIVSRSLAGLGGILWAPLLHGGWPHLLANTVPFLVFGFLAMAGGIAQFVAVTATIWLLGGLGVWLVGPSSTSTIGASGADLRLAGVPARPRVLRAERPADRAGRGAVRDLGRRAARRAAGRARGISWQGHLFGALAGLLCAALRGQGRPQARPR